MLNPVAVLVIVLRRVAIWLAAVFVVSCIVVSGAALAATRTGIAALEPATSVVAGLPAPQQVSALAAHVSQEGHWTLVNSAGEAFTAASAAELKRGFSILLPDLASSGGKLTVYLTADTVFAPRARLADLPRDAELWLAVVQGTYRLLADGGGKLFAELKPGLLLQLGDAAGFAEAMTLLARPLDRSGFRLLALEPGGPRMLASSPRRDPATKRPLVDAIDPNVALDALASLRGQTALLVGRLDGDTLAFKPTSAPERTLRWSELVAAAAAADVNVLLLRSSAGTQPGGRNWLWQTVEVKGLDDALSRATLADAFAALNAPDGRLAVTVTLASADRTLLDVRVPSGLPAPTWSTARIGSVLSDAVAGLAGKVVHQGALADFRSVARQAELDRRLLPFVPSLVQWGYGGLLLLGLLGWPVAARWWARLWPAEQPTEYANVVGFWAARVVRQAAFWLLFLPLAAPISAPRTLAASVWRPRAA